MYDEAAEYLDHEAELCVQGPRRVKGNQLPRTIFHAIDQSLLPPDEKNLERLAQEGFVLISAGSDTTARAFKYAMYHLLANPTLLERLRQELQTVMPDVTSKPHMKVLNGLPFFVSSNLGSSPAMLIESSRLPLSRKICVSCHSSRLDFPSYPLLSFGIRTGLFLQGYVNSFEPP